MDPDAALQRLVRAITAMDTSPTPEVYEEVAEAAADLVTWLNKGGALPAAWGQQPRVYLAAVVRRGRLVVPSLRTARTAADAAVSALDAADGETAAARVYELHERAAPTRRADVFKGG